jgi:hypothetical protein
MRLLLLLALTRGELRADDRYDEGRRLGRFPIRLACGRVWGHNGAPAGSFTNAFTRGNRTAVVLVNRDPTDERRALDATLCA